MSESDYTPQTRHGKWIAQREPECFDVLMLPRLRELPYGFTLRTSRGTDAVNRLFDGEAESGYFGKLGVVLAFVVAIAMVGMSVLAAGATAANPPEPSVYHDPANMLVIPGVNALIPWSAAVYVLIALVLCVGVHEAAHALFGLSHGVDLGSYGLMFIGPLPMGAFVESDGEYGELPAWPQLEVLAAGPLSNLWLAGVFVWASGQFPGTPSPEVLSAGLQAWAQQAGAAEINTLVPVYGHPVTDIAVWGTMLSVNLALMNLLPIGGLDGGRMAAVVMDAVGERLGIGSTNRTRAHRALSITLVGALALTIFGPHVL